MPISSGENEGFRILDEFVWDAHPTPEGGPIGQGENEGITVPPDPTVEQRMGRRVRLLRLTPLRFAALLLFAALATWLYLLWVERSFHEPPNYTLIEDGLYLGGSVPEPPPGTTAVINLCEVADLYPAEVAVWQPIRDGGPAPSIDWLRRVVETIDAQRQAGRTTFVHCQAGISRGGMAVTAYEMFKHRWGRDEALAFVRSKRPQVHPNPEFMGLLAEWERVVKGRPAAE
jgi:hypothetical protein